VGLFFFLVVVFQVAERIDLLNKVMMIKQSVEQAPAMIVVVFEFDVCDVIVHV
jgi:hypothetical protein